MDTGRPLPKLQRNLIAALPMFAYIVWFFFARGSVSEFAVFAALIGATCASLALWRFIAHRDQKL